MDNYDLIERLARLRGEMLRCSGILKLQGYPEHGKEMFGASKMLATWIKGIQAEQNNPSGKGDL